METRGGRGKHQWTKGNRKRRGGKGQVETVIDQRTQGEAGGDSGRPRERQGEAGGDAWHCSFLCAVALAGSHWSPDCYIYQAAV